MRSCGLKNWKNDRLREYCPKTVKRVSPVRIVIGYELDDPGFESRQIFHISSEAQLTSYSKDSSIFPGGKSAGA